MIDLIKQETCIISSVEEIALDTFEMKIINSYLSTHAKPGQFLHIRVDEFTLRRPISIADIDRANEEITIIFKTFGAGTERLASYQKGMTINVIGPNGNGFPMNQSQKVLLIGGGVGVPPIHFLGKKLAAQHVELTAILGFQHQSSIFYEDEFKQFSQTIIVTNDGSYGEKGFVTDVLSHIDDFEHYYACGPLPMLKAVRKQLPHKQGYLSLEERMACGVGACFACVIPTKDRTGYRKICQDGPVFQAEEIIL